MGLQVSFCEIIGVPEDFLSAKDLSGGQVGLTIHRGESLFELLFENSGALKLTGHLPVFSVHGIQASIFVQKVGCHNPDH